MRVLLHITAVCALALVLMLKEANTQPEGRAPLAGDPDAFLAKCVKDGQFCSGKFTTNCCSEFCLVAKGNANGKCATKKACVKNGGDCKTNFTTNCCSKFCLFQPGDKKGKCQNQ